MKTPVLIIGSGLSGLITAYRLSKQGIDCVVVSKDERVIEGSNSVYAQGGIIYRSPQDSISSLESDILSAGDHINSREAVHQLATDGIDLVKELLIDDITVPFDHDVHQFSFTKEAAHQLARIIHVKDHTGRSIMNALWKKIQKSPHVTFLKGHVLVDLLTSGHNCRGYELKYHPNRCLGAYLYDVATHKVITVLSPFTVLCTGGIGQVYQYHTNAEHAFGSGLAAANRARVRIINARFIQFHPTALWTSQEGRRFLISEALRGEGARLMNCSGRYIMDFFPKKDLESRAVVSQAIMEDLDESGDPYVMLNLVDHYKGSLSIPERFPSIYEHCLSVGIDISKEPIPVVPAEHFFCGGIAVGLDGQSELPGLYAAGEVSCTGVHGSNRLASSSLLECLTWGVKAADSIGNKLNEQQDPSLERAFELVDEWQSFGNDICNPAEIRALKSRIRLLMWNKVGVIRSKDRLFAARDELHMIWKDIDQRYSSSALNEELIELRHMIETSYLIAHSASSHTSLKEDSLGGHVLR